MSYSETCRCKLEQLKGLHYVLVYISCIERDAQLRSLYLQNGPCVSICMEALKDLDRFMEAQLLSEGTLKITLQAIQNYAVDIKRCRSMLNTNLPISYPDPSCCAHRVRGLSTGCKSGYARR